MSGTTKITTTRTDGWQKRSRKWAQDGESFEIHGIAASHLAFCKELCETFDYECEYQSDGAGPTATFVPASA